MNVLVVNAGSSSLKLRLLGPSDDVLAVEHVTPWQPGDATATTDAMSRIAAAGQPGAIGHRVVHGGERFTASTLLDGAVVEELRLLTPLAPLHQPAALAGIDGARAVFPAVPMVACFDTAYHATMPEAAATYALPTEWREQWPLRRFGFHGLSHAYAARRAAELVSRDLPGFRVVTCHLGAGASLCASLDGQSVDTTMGFTPLEGLVMATRSGSVDPGLVLWLINEMGLPPSEVAEGLVHRSGLRGLAGSGDMRAVLDARRAGDEAAILALNVYLHRLVGAIAAMAASIGGIDALAFTGGVGENAPAVRLETAQRLAHLGVAVDPNQNERVVGVDAEIGAVDAIVRTVVIAAREDLEIARQVRLVVGAGANPAGGLQETL
jgi:acetate kinase